MISYEGIFFNEETSQFIHSLEKPQLEITNDIIHCTFKYHPNDDELFDELVGKEIEVLLIGYANDGHNSGFKIKLPDEIKPYYINYDEQNPTILKTPHIAASIAKGAKASDTKNLKFKELSTKYKVKGIFGYWIKKEDNEYLSTSKKL